MFWIRLGYVWDMIWICLGFVFRKQIQFPQIKNRHWESDNRLTINVLVLLILQNIDFHFPLYIPYMSVYSLYIPCIFPIRKTEVQFLGWL